MPQTPAQVRSIPQKAALSLLLMACVCLALLGVSPAQSRAKMTSSPSPQQRAFGDQISGMYTFLREGEFVQISVEEGKLTGFVSRYGDRESDKDAFLDQFFSKGSLEGNRINFTTKPVHGTWFEFSGKVNRGEAKVATAEGYWVIRGTLKEYDEDEV